MGAYIEKRFFRPGHRFDYRKPFDFGDVQMKKCKIDLLLEEINKLNGDCKYPQMGHLQYSNIAGDGRGAEITVQDGAA